VPAFLGVGGLLYAITATVGGLCLAALAVQVYARRSGERSVRAAQHLFAFSILYLVLLFSALLAEHGLGLWHALPRWPA